ncbi:hypothetical protein BTR22_19075 [Alkalihalophilus pseudofirmus]|uniref:hypothetical protein n=1 Tax=Alkalihalophilus pseudofirmus TaxID=79885 RepID=UPI000950DC61|nr:hypothetical protein BTR22_19075 [Alkalihalophilus pseudofirmus]
MKAQPLKELNKTEIAVILDAMKSHMFNTGRSSARMILTDYIKIFTFRNEAKLDGMGMEHIYYSLISKANQLEKWNTHGEVMDLAQFINLKREEFQQSFYRIYIKKEAPTAATVSASTNI